MHRYVDDETWESLQGRSKRPGSHMRGEDDVLELESTWTVEESGLMWYVPLLDVVECDIDIEYGDDFLVVRARGAAPRFQTMYGYLLVPRCFDLNSAGIRYEAGVLEIRVIRAVVGIQP